MSAKLEMPSPVARQFAELPASKPFANVQNHLLKLSGITLTRFAASDELEEPFITFYYRDYVFRIDEGFGKLRLLSHYRNTQSEWCTQYCSIFRGFYRRG